MPIPDFQSLMLPALKAFAGGGEPSLSEIRERIAAAEGLSEEDVREMLPSGRQAVFVNRVSWAVIHMERAGLLARVRRGVYRLTQEGERLLPRKPSRIDLNLLGEYPDFAEWSQRANAPPSGKEVFRQGSGLQAARGNRRHPGGSAGPRCATTEQRSGSRCAASGSRCNAGVSRTGCCGFADRDGLRRRRCPDGPRDGAFG